MEKKLTETIKEAIGKKKKTTFPLSAVDFKAAKVLPENEEVEGLIPLNEAIENSLYMPEVERPSKMFIEEVEKAVNKTKSDVIAVPQFGYTCNDYTVEFSFFDADYTQRMEEAAYILEWENEELDKIAAMKTSEFIRYRCDCIRKYVSAVYGEKAAENWCDSDDLLKALTVLKELEKEKVVQKEWVQHLFGDGGADA